ncbi:MAG TPA: glutamine--fructose-6-phosphate transaminase (isomerizing) [Candidatus Saccharimonadales bacterium]|nr:glutamine--fructose-6-phosphate transaminase (isomerizing) [Candidatus Saccharimonadales bacterium]
MCGIVGYIGNKSASDIILAGLKALEYRGYDSAGIALLDKQAHGHLLKQVGRVDGLALLLQESQLPLASIAIGHTRWATHGKPSILNAHPHANQEQTIFVVHNGIIENYVELSEGLQKHGYSFVSDTDTEVIPHLIDFYYRELHDFEKAFEKALGDLSGAYAIAAINAYEPEKLFVARLSSPLVLGEGKDEYIVASDPTAIMAHTKQVIFLQDNEVAVITPKGYALRDLKARQKVLRQAERLDYDIDQIALGTFPHFMLKEIFEAPQTIRLASAGRTNIDTHSVKLGGLEGVAEQLQHIDRIVIVACGTASYAGMIGEYLIEELAGIPVEVQIGSEFKYRKEPFSRGTALIAVSQSGETADTIAAVKKAQQYGALCLGVVNAVGSTVARMTDAGVYCHAGTEQAVASTKAFIAQVVVLLQIGLMLGRGKSPLYNDLLREIEALPDKAETVLKLASSIKKLAGKYKNYKDFLFIGRRYAYPTALEGTLKLKECALIHAEGYAAGEMKHGPLSLIDESFPTFALAGDGPMYAKTCANIEEIKTRGGPVIVIATEGNRTIKKVVDDVIYIPKTLEQTEPILMAIVMQLFAYYMAIGKGFNVDRPRNLAKSVTVE